MGFVESLRMAFDALWANKMRALLTMLGIIIGISSVLTMVGLGKGGQAKMKKQFEGYGMTRAEVYINSEEIPSEEYLISSKDIDMIQRAFSTELAGLTPKMNTSGILTLGKKAYHMNLNGVNESYGKIEKITIKEGRFLNREDILNGRAVCVIDQKMVTKFYSGKNPVGSRIAIDIGEESSSYLVVGVYEKDSSIGGASREEYNLFVPYSNIQVLSEVNDFYQFELTTKPDVLVEPFLKRVVNLLERRHDSVGKKYYMSYSSQKEMKMFGKVTGMMTVFVSAIAGISLVVGGIGIMNIMLVSVTERTKEIGTRKALGASKKEIMLQFLIESVVVSGIGGIIGIIAGFGFGHLIGRFVKLTPVIPLNIIVISILFSATIGIFFGLYPAKKAADLNPIDALRYE